MLSALVHRGPDAEGTWSDACCWLGHRRLSIIDLSDAARQPLANETGTIWLTFNGEIYNFQALRHELERHGHRFRSQSDSEAVLHAYEQWGVDGVGRLRGMFAFAVWDAERRRLVLARDRVGKKPLFYANTGRSFVFASEMQAVVASGEVGREVDLASLDRYLTCGYVPGPGTILRDVRKLPPAHVMTVDVRDDALVVETCRYWSLSYQPKSALREDEAAEALREKLAEAVRLRMVSDVPLGAFLSGGIDSTIVVGLMASISTAPVRTFSIGFGEARWDERDAARRVARRWGTRHEELVVEPRAADVVPMLVQHFGEPFADSSAIPTYYVAKMTRQHVTVALTGDGGDESFAGYDRYRAFELAERVAALPGAAATARALAGILPPNAGPRTAAHRAKQFLSGIGAARVERYSAWVGGSAGHFTAADKSSLYAPELRHALDGRVATGALDDLFARAADLDDLDVVMCVDVHSYLPYDLLVKADITSMANGLEARCPLLDTK